MNDAVFWGAILSVVGSVIVLGFIFKKALDKINTDHSED